MRLQVLSILLVAFAFTGCTSTPLPPAKQIAQIRLTVMRMPDEREPLAKARVVNLTEREDIVPVLDWLHTIDWSQKGSDMKVIDVPPPDGNIEITTKAGDSQDYGFYWDGGFLHSKANRFMQGGDKAMLRQLVQRVCK